MEPEELKARARRLPEELLTQGDLAVADEILTADCACHLPLPGSGVAGAKAWASALRRAFPDLCAVVEDEIAEGDRVVLRIACSGTPADDPGERPAAGERLAWRLVTIQRLGVDGKFAELWLGAEPFLAAGNNQSVRCVCIANSGEGADASLGRTAQK